MVVVRIDLGIAIGVVVLFGVLGGIKQGELLREWVRAVEANAEDAIRQIVHIRGRASQFGIVLQVRIADHAVVRAPAVGSVEDFYLRLALGRIDALDSLHMAEQELGVGQALVLHQNATEDLHHLAELHVTDEAHIVDLDRLPACANARLRQTGVINEQLVDVAFVWIGYQRKARGGCLRRLIVVVLAANSADVDRLRGQRKAMPRFGFPSEQRAHGERFGVFRFAVLIDELVARAQVEKQLTAGERLRRRCCLLRFRGRDERRYKQPAHCEHCADNSDGYFHFRPLPSLHTFVV